MPNIKVIGGLKSHTTTLKKSALPRSGGAIVHKAVMPEYLQPAMSASGVGGQTNLETLREHLKNLNLSKSSGSGQKKKKYIVF